MGIFDLFKNKEISIQPDPKEAMAILYPERMLINTTDRTKDGTRFHSTHISLLPVDVDSARLGAVVRNHLSLSRFGMDRPTDANQLTQAFFRAGRFRNAKEFHHHALLLRITEKEGSIYLIPTKNEGPSGRASGFTELHGNATKLKAGVGNKDLGDHVMAAWSRCSCEIA